jgi:hypothetical protein
MAKRRDHRDVADGLWPVAHRCDQHLSLFALEFVNFYTDHEKFTSPGFYNGKTEHYERHMFCIQGSMRTACAAPRRRRQCLAQARHGDRYVEFLLPDNSFDALKALFISQDFDRVRVPKRDQKQWEVDTLRSGPPSERQVLRPGDPAAVDLLWRDVAALANAGGGVLIVGVEKDGTGLVGITRPDHVAISAQHGSERVVLALPDDGADQLRRRSHSGGGARARSAPYMCDDGVTYVRRDGETLPADH